MPVKWYSLVPAALSEPGPPPPVQAETRGSQGQAASPGVRERVWLVQVYAVLSVQQKALSMSLWGERKEMKFEAHSLTP